MVTTDETADLITDNIIESGLRPHFNYSGRGMYGSTCLGIAGDQDTIDSCLDNIKKTLNKWPEDYSDVDEVLEILGNPIRESMGLDVIVYFPSLSLPNYYDPNYKEESNE